MEIRDMKFVLEWHLRPVFFLLGMFKGNPMEIWVADLVIWSHQLGGLAVM